MAWRVEFFEVSRGTSPPYDFLTRLPLKARAKVTRAVELLEQGGPHIGEPYVKALTGRPGLFELRTSHASDAFRLFFFQAGREHIVVVHGIRKKTERTPARDLDTAEQRRAHYLGRQ